MKKWLMIVIFAFVAFTLVACGSEDNSADGKKYKVGATQIVEHSSLDAAYEGFKVAIEDAGLDVKYDFQNAQDDKSNVKTISDKFVADNVDLIFANSTPSALGALQATRDIPIVFTSVTDAVETGIVESMDQGSENVTGVVDLHPDAIKKTVEFIDKYFEGASVGLIYNAGEQNSVIQIEAVQKAAEGTSLSLKERTVANSSEVQQAATTLVEDVDVIYIITDNTVVSALDSVVGVANDQKIPLIVGEPDSLAKGGFATFGIDYYTIGYRAGEMAAEILQGNATTKDIPAELPPEIQLYINKDAVEAQNIEWNEEWDEMALFVESETK
jgi:putative ABC transport system substrate-binding protein